jgi:hypothetical protein
VESRITIFSKLVRDIIRDVPLEVPMATALGETVQRMENAKASSATITDSDGHGF